MTADWKQWSGKGKGVLDKLVGSVGRAQKHGMRMMFVASQYEVLRDDAVNAHLKAQELGIMSVLEMSNTRLHCLPLFTDIPEGLEYTAKIAQFISKLNS